MNKEKKGAWVCKRFHQNYTDEKGARVYQVLKGDEDTMLYYVDGMWINNIRTRPVDTVKKDPECPQTM